MNTMVSRTLSVHQEHEFLLKLEVAGLTDELAQRVIAAKGNVLASRIVQLICGDEQQCVPVPGSRLIKTLTVTCHGNATASQLVKGGTYYSSTKWITDECFPIQPHDLVTDELELFQFDHDSSHAEVLAERTRRNLGEPTYEHGFYLGIQHPDEQREQPIVITHKPVQDQFGSPRVLVLYGGAVTRKLGLRFTGDGWPRYYVFAGVRKAAS